MRRTTKKQKLPDVLPWEEGEPSRHGSKVVFVLILVLITGLVIGYEAGITHDPPITPTAPTTGHGDNNTNRNGTFLVAPSNVSGIVILPSYWIVSGGNLIMQYSVLFSTNLVPTWTNQSGWITTYAILVPPGTYNVTLTFCQPLRQVDVRFNPNGTVSWSVVGKAIVQTVAPRSSFSFECGIF